MSARFSSLLLASITASILLAGCHTADLALSASSDSGTMTVLATDYRFEGHDIVPAGDTIVRMRNHGHEVHHIQLVRLEGERTRAELIEALHSPVTQIPGWAKQMGGPNAIGSGNQVEALVYLEPGRYVLICLVPANDGTPHAVLGMHKALEVVGASSAAWNSGTPSDYHLAMADYDFTLLETIASGQHTFRAVNRGSHVHEASLVRLAPHASVDDVLASFVPGTTDALPGILMGGITGLEQGVKACSRRPFRLNAMACSASFPILITTPHMSGEAWR